MLNASPSLSYLLFRDDFFFAVFFTDFLADFAAFFATTFFFDFAAGREDFLADEGLVKPSTSPNVRKKLFAIFHFTSFLINK